jgi:hypothetical protein
MFWYVEADVLRSMPFLTTTPSSLDDSFFGVWYELKIQQTIHAIYMSDASDN